jgi:hypothetical protein
MVRIHNPPNQSSGSDGLRLNPPGLAFSSATESVCLAAVLGVAVFLYRGAFQGFFEQDDFSWLWYSRYSSIQEWVQCFFRFNGAGNYRPLSQETYFWLGRKLFGLWPPGYHLVSIALHLLASLLVYRLLRLFCPALQSMASTLFFAVHNAHFSSLYWISALPEPLALLFYLAALISFIRSDRESRWDLYVLSLSFMGFALLSKESILSLPLVLAAYCLIFSRPRLLRTVPYFLVSALYLLLRVTSQTVKAAPYLLTFGREAWNNLCTYLTWTAGFSGVLLRFKMKWNPEAIYPLAVVPLALLAVALLILSKNRRVGFFAVLWYFIALQPVLYFSHHIYSYYLAPALPAVALLLASSLPSVRSLRDWKRWIPILTLLYLSIATSLASLKREGRIWNDRSFVARDIIAGMPEVARELPPGHQAFILGLGSLEFGAMQGELALRVYGFPPERFVLVGLNDRTLRDFESAATLGVHNEFYCFTYGRTGFINVTDRFRRDPESFLRLARSIKPFTQP